MIEMDEIKKEFSLHENKVQILKGISLTINKGEFVSIMGPSGSGKSTLSSILGCLASPTAGNYKIDGVEVGSLSSLELAKLRNQKIGFIFQDFNLLEGLSALENVALPLFYAKIPTAERRERARKSLKTVGLEDRMYHLPNQLSGGQKQRVAIARALVNEPSFLFADEPTGALDKKTGYEILGLMQRLNFLGHTVVQVTHSALDASYSKRILHLVDGLIVKDELVDRPAIGGLVQESESNEKISRLWRVLQSYPSIKPQHETFVEKLFSQSQSVGTFIEATKALSKVELPNPHRLWERVWKHESWGVRAELLKVLWGKPSELTLPYAYWGMEDKNAWVRYLAAVLIKRSSPFDITSKAKEVAEMGLKDTDERVRATIAAWLGAWRESYVLTLLRKAMKDTDGRVRANSLDSFLFLHRAGITSPDIATIADDAINDKNNRARANAAILLHGFNPTKAINNVLSMLESPNNLMRASSAWALGVIGNESHVSRLVSLLMQENDELAMGQMIKSIAKLSEKNFDSMTSLRLD